MAAGTYCLLLENGPACVKVGALGPTRFPAGYHVYVGSALGPGGLSRVSRHARLSRGEPGPRLRWHIDYLLRSPAFRLDSAMCVVTPERLECRLAGLLPGSPVPGFGCSDCKCPSHLFSFADYPRAAVTGAMHRLAPGVPIKTIKI
jgi:Uri superfamily endonuclease